MSYITKSRRPHRRPLSFSSALHLALVPAVHTSLPPTAVPFALVPTVTNMRHHRSPGPALSHRRRLCRPGPEGNEGIVMKRRAPRSNA
jgi:hypothetical protein